MFPKLPGCNQIWCALTAPAQHPLTPSLGTACPENLCTHTPRPRSIPTCSLLGSAHAVPFTSLLHPPTSSQWALPLLSLEFISSGTLSLTTSSPKNWVKTPPPGSPAPVLTYTAALQHLLHSRFTAVLHQVLTGTPWPGIQKALHTGVEQMNGFWK